MSADKPQKGERRRKLVAAARRLFADPGYARVTPDEIAEAAGVATALAARSFPAKPAYARGVADEFVELFALPDEEAEGDPVAQLHALTAHYVKVAGKKPRDTRVFLALLTLGDAAVTAELGPCVHELARPAVPVVAAGQQAGLFRRSVDAHAVAWEWLRGLLGAWLVVPLAGPVAVEPANAAHLIDGLLHGLLKTDV